MRIAPFLLCLAAACAPARPTGFYDDDEAPGAPSGQPESKMVVITPEKTAPKQVYTQATPPPREVMREAPRRPSPILETLPPPPSTASMVKRFTAEAPQEPPPLPPTPTMAAQRTSTDPLLDARREEALPPPAPVERTPTDKLDYTQVDGYNGREITVTGRFAHSKFQHGILTLDNGLVIYLPHFDQFRKGDDWLRYVGRTVTVSGTMHTTTRNIDGYRGPSIDLRSFSGPAPGE